MALYSSTARRGSGLVEIINIFKGNSGKDFEGENLPKFTKILLVSTLILPFKGGHEEIHHNICTYIHPCSTTITPSFYFQLISSAPVKNYTILTAVIWTGFYR